MQSILLQIAVAAAALLLTAASIAQGDRDVLVAAPDSVVENFVRAVVAGRFTPARRHLSGNAAAEMAALSELRNAVREAVGGIHAVEGHTEQSDGNRAIATATVHGDARIATILATLVFQQGEWRIVEWSTLGSRPRDG